MPLTTADVVGALTVGGVVTGPGTVVTKVLAVVNTLPSVPVPTMVVTAEDTIGPVGTGVVEERELGMPFPPGQVAAVLPC